MNAITVIGRGILTASASHSPAGVLIRVASAPRQRPVLWADVRLSLSQLRSLAADVEDAVIASGSFAAPNGPRDDAEAKCLGELIDSWAFEGLTAADGLAALEIEINGRLQ